MKQTVERAVSLSFQLKYEQALHQGVVLIINTLFNTCSLYTHQQYISSLAYTLLLLIYISHFLFTYNKNICFKNL